MATEHEFPRPVSLHRLPPGGHAFMISPSAAECDTVARRLGLLALEDLRAEGRVAETPGRGLVEVTGTLHAQVVQRCDVTLEPVPQAVEASFRRLFALAASSERDVLVDPELDEPEPLPEGLLDLGEIAVEELSLALDPYPRAAGAGQVLAELLPDAEEDGGPHRPFAAALADPRRP